MIEPVVLHSLIVEPRTVARLPLQTTDHAEFSTTATRHVVAAFLQLDRRRAIEAALPPFFLRYLCKPLCSFVLRTFSARMPFTIAGRTNLGLAAGTFAVFAAPVQTARSVNMDIGRLDPFATATSGAVETVLGGVFLVFLVPFHFELCVEELLNVFKGNMVGCAAFRRHMGWICNGHGENAS